MVKHDFIEKFIVISWVVVSSLIALMVLGGTMYYKIINTTAPMPEVLSNWGGIILGFYFGSFTSIAKDILSKKGGCKESIEASDQSLDSPKT
jgi:hypothetical protein